MYNCNQTPVLKVFHVIFLYLNKIFGIYLITLPLRGKMFTTLDLKKKNLKQKTCFKFILIAVIQFI